MPPAELEVEVLAVGASAAGLTSSLALSRYGFRHVLVERHRGAARTSSAAHTQSAHRRDLASFRN